VHLFLIAWNPTGDVDVTHAAEATRELVAQLPHFESGSVVTWTAATGTVAVVSAAHAPAELGGRRHLHADGRGMGLFAGRPILWEGETEADGATALDPVTYLSSFESCVERLDGRFVVARHDETRRTLDVLTDALGAYPLYTARDGGTLWLGNNVELLRRSSGVSAMRPLALASFLGMGFSLGGEALWDGVRRVPGGTWISLSDGELTRPSLLGAADVARLFSGTFDPAAAGATLVAATRALGDWPGRPVTVSLTGGRDSRLVLAAAVRSGMAFTAQTMAHAPERGSADSEDVRVARLVAAAAGVPHEVVAEPPGETVASRLRLLRLVSPGTVAISELGPLGPNRALPGIELNLGGQGGELARLHYGSGEDDDTPRALVDRLFVTTVNRWPRPLLNGDGEASVRDWLGAWVSEQLEAGAAPRDVPDVFYLTQRMGSWAAQIGAVKEYRREPATPLWTRRLLGHQFAVSAEERGRDTFHRVLLESLDRPLSELPFAGAQPGWTQQRWEVLARKAARELRRRAAAHLPRTSARSPLAEVLPELRAGVASAAAHPAWAVLNRQEVEKLLRQDPRSLHPRSRQHLWRLATLFLSGAEN
jgi:hypothetical protein